MSRGTHADFLSEFRQVGPEPVLMLEIPTGTTPTHIRLTSNEVDHVWPTGGSDTFEARPFEMGPITLDGAELGAIEVRIADVDHVFNDWLASIDFRFKRMTRFLVDRSEMSSATKAMKDVLRISHHTREAYGIVLHAEPLQAILQRVTLPTKVMTREDFPGMLTEGVIR